MRIKAVLFDLDGTLLNRVESQYERLGKILNHMPKESYVSRFIQLDKRGYVWKDKVYQQLVQEFNIVAITWEELLQDYINEFKNNCVAFPNLISLLEQLKTDNYLLGIITNGYGHFQMNNIKALAIEKYFDVILVSEWENMKKPNPQLFMRALDKLQTSPQDSIFLGDHPENDVKGAQAVGMKGIWKKDAQWDHVEADAIIDNLSELPSTIDYFNNIQ
ncbi:HAD family hydrolase [Lysinibacillus fusiformis]|uniref:HAD family hydrolase n=1 Tax=Lysinibacillus fusiformis TaxID=28031 RepID=UPI0004693F6B|nr:HAD family hydrolase [Lysinibacillus fusiformis]